MRFGNPLMLWLMAATLPLLAWFLLWTWRRRQVLMTQFIQARLLPTLTTRMAPRREQLSRLLLFLAVALLFLALARPQWGYSWEETRQRGLDIVVAIDTSRSMLAEDLAPNRLARAKLAALDLLQLARADRLGLVAFAGTAFLQCPLTLDPQAFRLSLDALDTRIIPQGGTAIAAAIDTSLSAFRNDDNFKVLVLISDGEDHDDRALAAAQNAAKKGLRIFTLGVGTPEGELLRFVNDQGQLEYLKDPDGNVVLSRLNETLLQQIATVANGFYLPLAATGSIRTLYQQGLDPLPKAELGSRLHRRYHERYHWPLALAILLLALEAVLPHRRQTTGALATHTRTAASLVPLFAGSLLLPTTQPTAASPASALEHYQANRYAEAQKTFQELYHANPNDPRLAYNLGTAAYRAGDYLTAARAFTNALTAPSLPLQQRSFYNLGNTLYQQGDHTADTTARASLWQQALQSFQAALQLDPTDADAQNNLDFVRRRLQELELEQQPQDQPGEQEQEQEQEQGQPETDQPQPGTDTENQPPEDQSGDPTPTEDDSPPPDDDGESSVPVPAGQMTPEDARRLLDSQRDQERAMIFLPPTNAVPRQVLRDW